MNSEEAEVIERNRKMGITVRRAPINYVGAEVIPTKPKRAASKSLTDMTPEEIKKRKAERALLWYHKKVAADPSYKEKRRQDAKKWPKKKPVE